MNLPENEVNDTRTLSKSINVGIVILLFSINARLLFEIMPFRNLHNECIWMNFQISHWFSRYVEMHLSASVLLIITCILTQSAVGITEIVDSDSVVFPDQTDYIKLSVKCKENMVLWPGTLRCYKEGEQGPCNVGRVLLFNRRLLKPYCKDLIF